MEATVSALVGAALAETLPPRPVEFGVNALLVLLKGIRAIAVYVLMLMKTALLLSRFSFGRRYRRCAVLGLEHPVFVRLQ